MDNLIFWLLPTLAFVFIGDMIYLYLKNRDKRKRMLLRARRRKSRSNKLHD